MRPFLPRASHRSASSRGSVRLVGTLACVVLFSGCGVLGDDGGGQQRAGTRQTDGDWRDWNTEEWAREAGDFSNPVIEGLWDTGRMRDARDDPAKRVDGDIAGADGVTDPEPPVKEAESVATPYHAHAAPVGRLFFDTPAGSQSCSATVVEDPAQRGKSNLVWTAGHCVHAGREGGWFRNIVFVPSYNDEGLGLDDLGQASARQASPFGTWWADWAATSQQWIAEGTAEGGDGAPFDFAVLHVKPAPDSDGRSLQETVGAALPVGFGGPPVQDVTSLGAWGYPASQPFDGATMHMCEGEPGRLSLDAEEPTMYRIGCTMTGGSSGGGWFTVGADGRTTLVSNTSIGPDPAAWLAGPYLGETAEAVFDGVSDRFADR